MRYRPMLALLAAAACAEGNPPAGNGNGTAATPVAAMPGQPTPVAAPPAPSSDPADTGATPATAALRVFGDWIVGCDNVGTCKAVSLGTDGGDTPLLSLAIERGAGAGPMSVRISGYQGARLPGRIAIPDGPAIAGGTQDGDEIVFTESQALSAARAIAEGKAARVTAAEERADVSVKGAAAALRWMDAQQGRAGTQSAFVARGAAPDLRGITTPPVIRAVAVSGSPVAIDEARRRSLERQAGCTLREYFPDTTAEVEAHALGGGRSLVLVPCDTGAYNMMSAAFIANGDAIVPARLDAPTGMSPDPQPVPTVVNAAFEDGVLSTYAKGRGIGDCGIAQRFVWDGARFRLSEQSEMSECRGSTDQIVTWRARVVR